MAGLTEDKIAMLKGLVAASPDEVVNGLKRAVAAGGGVGPMAAIGAMVEAEAADRVVRFQTLAPLAPLFAQSHTDGRQAFPRPALGALWRALKNDRPEWVQQAADACYYIDPDEPYPSIFNTLCARASAGLKTRQNADYAMVLDIVEGDQPGAGRLLILALDIAPIVRPALLALTDWLQRMTDQRRATARLAYADASAAGDGGGPLMFEMLSSHLKHPTQILRVVSGIMDHPGERYLADSELAMFGERALARIERNLEQVRTLRPGTGVDTARQAASAAQRAIEEIAEFEQAIQVSKDAPWGQRLGRLKHGVAAAVEMRLKEIDEAVLFAMPVQKQRVSGRLMSIMPRLDMAPDPDAVRWAIGLLTFCEAVRPFSNEGGFGGAHVKVVDTVGKRIDQYVEDVLEQMRLGDLPNDTRAREFLDVAAAMLTLVRDKKSAGLIRRRAAAA